MALNIKQKTFVREYLLDLNATQAAIRAGYSKKTANVQGPRLLVNVGIKAAIDKAQDKRAARTETDQDYIINTIKDTIERCGQHKPVFDKEGKPVMIDGPDGVLVPAYTFDAGNVLRGSELLGKHHGMWKDRLEIEAKVFGEMTDEELLEKAAKLTGGK